MASLLCLGLAKKESHTATIFSGELVIHITANPGACIGIKDTV